MEALLARKVALGRLGNAEEVADLAAFLAAQRLRDRRALYPRWRGTITSMQRTGRAFDLAGKFAVVTGGAGLPGVQHAGALAEATADLLRQSERARQETAGVACLPRQIRAGETGRMMYNFIFFNTFCPECRGTN